jgi:hypothetical protein
MSRYEKNTFTGTIVYAIVTIIFVAFSTYETGDPIPALITFILLFLLFGMFYLGFKKRKSIFAHLCNCMACNGRHECHL